MFDVYTLEALYEDSRKSILENPSSGARRVHAHLERLLAAPQAVFDEIERDPTPGRRLLHHDKTTGLHVILILSKGGRRTPPHDHGASWAVYGIARGSSKMQEWTRLDDGSKPGFADIELSKQYVLLPGQAKVFENRAIHTAESAEGTILIRITGTDLDTIETLEFDPAAKSAKARTPRHADSAERKAG